MISWMMIALADFDDLKSDIRLGMTREQIRKVLPKHNYFYRNQRSVFGAKPPWSRDQVGPMSYLICTYGNKQDDTNIKDNDAVTSVEIVNFTDIAKPNSDGSMFKVEGIEKPVSAAVWDCICLIHQSPEMNPLRFDPIVLIRAVNGLRKHGKVAAIEALIHYRYISMDWNGENQERLKLDQERIYNICHLLFLPEKPDIKMPPHPGRKEPLVVVNDIPFYLRQTGPRRGPPLDPIHLINFCNQNCTLREKPMLPNASPIVAVEQLCELAFLRNRNSSPIIAPDQIWDPRERIVQFVREQALRCLRLPKYEEFKSPEYFDDNICPAGGREIEADKFWDKYTQPLRSLTIIWDADKQEYNVKEGSK